MLESMCGRYTNTLGPDEIGKHFGVTVNHDTRAKRFNIPPTEQVLAIVAPDGRPETRMLRWGLLPRSRRPPPRHPLINARVEKVRETWPFRDLIPQASTRALQIADGYFEWQKPEKRGEPRQPFYFQVDHGQPFAFASLWTETRVEGETAQSCTLLTCDPADNRIASAIHNRMPVILADTDAQQAWLDPRLDAQEALSLCGPLPADRLSSRPVNPTVNNVRASDGPELLAAPPNEPGGQLALG